MRRYPSEIFELVALVRTPEVSKWFETKSTSRKQHRQMHDIRGRRQLLLNHDHSISDHQKLPNCSAHESTASLALPTSYKTTPHNLHHWHREVDPSSAGSNITCAMNSCPLHSFTATNKQDLHQSPGCPEHDPPPHSFVFLLFSFFLPTTMTSTQQQLLPNSNHPAIFSPPNFHLHCLISALKGPESTPSMCCPSKSMPICHSR